MYTYIPVSLCVTIVKLPLHSYITILYIIYILLHRKPSGTRIYYTVINLHKVKNFISVELPFYTVVSAPESKQSNEPTRGFVVFFLSFLVRCLVNCIYTNVVTRDLLANKSLRFKTFLLCFENLISLVLPIHGQM